jgi:DHA1 family tetracycline resistance protein-like MFS transporter
MATNTRTTLRFVAFIVFIDMAGMGLITPVMPQLIQQITHADIGKAAEIGGYLLIAFAAMQFLFSPIMGSLSDRFGRRPVLLITLASFAIDYGVMAVAPTLALLAVGRMISGISGATWAAANSCIADTVPESERGGAFGLLGGAGAAGLVLGPAIGGIAGEYGVRLPFIIAAVLAAIGTLIGFFKFAETLPLEARRPFNLKRANPIGSLLASRTSPFTLGCLAVLFIAQLALQAQISVWPYYGAASFGWTPLTTGLTTGFYGVLMVYVRAVLTKRVVARYGPGTTARFAILFAIPSFVMIGLAGSAWVVIAAIVIGSMAGMVFPTVQAMVSTRTAPDAQGELQGMIASSGALTAIVGPLVMTQLFDHYVDKQGVYLPGAPFLLAAMLMVLGAALLWRLTWREA